MASVDEQKLVTPDRLRIVFDHIDVDKSGALSYNEIKEILCFESDFNMSDVDKIIKQADLDGDGEI